VTYSLNTSAVACIPASTSGVTPFLSTHLHGLVEEGVDNIDASIGFCEMEQD
jgi:hypothetical protein